MVLPVADEPSAPAREERLLKSTSVVGSMTLLSRLSGLAREIAFSHWLGAGVLMDAFVVAFKIPNLFRRFFAEGAFSQAFVPVITEYRSLRGEAETRELIDRTAGTFALILAAVTVVGVIAAPVLTLVFAAGFVSDDGRYALATDMLRLTFPYLLFISLTALAGSILNAHRRFAVAAFTPVLLNAVLVAAIAWGVPRAARPELALAGGVFVAGLVQLAFQIPFLVRLKLLPRPRFGFAHEGVRRVYRLMLPAMFGSSVMQISILFDTLIGSFLVAGSLSWLYYSDRLVEFPLGVFGIALATVILPRLAEQHARASAATFSATLDWALKLVLVIAVPATLGLAVLAAPLMATLFFGGEFTAQDVEMSAASLLAYAPGLAGFILVKVLAPGYFARQDTRTPVRVAVQALGLGVTLNVLLVVLFVETGWAPPHVGIAAATSVSALCNAALLLRGLRRAGTYRPLGGWMRLAAQVLGAAAVMTVALVLGVERIGDWFALERLERVAALMAAVAGAAIVYFAASWLFGMRYAQLRVASSAARDATDDGIGTGGSNG
jgi:putative peptidoglycan lipid II flippase